MIFLLFALVVSVGAQCTGSTRLECTQQSCCASSISDQCEWRCQSGGHVVCEHRKRLIANITEALNGKFGVEIEHAIFHTNDPLPASLAHLSDEIAQQRKRQKGQEEGSCACPSAIPCCPTNCTLQQWSAWSDCTVSCGGGTRTRTRAKATAEQCGGTCDALAQEGLCNTQCCPQDCSWSAWSGFGPCSATCGAGITTRTRSQQPAACGGVPCTGSVVDTFGCMQSPCPVAGVDCYVEAWSSWSACQTTASCGTGSQSRTRRIVVNRPGQCPPTSDSRDCTVSCPPQTTPERVTAVPTQPSQGGVITLPPVGSDVTSNAPIADTTTSRVVANSPSTGEGDSNAAIARQDDHNAKTDTESSDATDLTVPLAAAGGAIVAVFLLILLIVCIVRRKKKTKAANNNNSEHDPHHPVYQGASRQCVRRRRSMASW